MLPPSWDAAPAAPVQQNDPRHPSPIKQDKPSGPDQQRQAAKAAKNQQAINAPKEIEKAAADRRHSECLAFKEEGDHHLATLPLLPSARTLPLLLLCSRTILATLLPSSRTGLRALIGSERLPRRLGTRRLLTPARRLRRLRPTVVMLSNWRSRRVGDHHLPTLPLLPPSWHTAPAAPVQQNGSRHPAPIQKGRPARRLRRPRPPVIKQSICRTRSVEDHQLITQPLLLFCSRMILAILLQTTRKGI